MKNRLALRARYLAAVLALSLALLPAAALAAVEMTAASDKATVTAGDAVEVTLTVSGKGMAAADGVFTYDSSLLTYASSDGGASDGLISMVSLEKGGSSTLTARIQFTAAAAGTAKVDFSLEKVLGYNGDELGSAAASVSVAVEASPIPPTPTTAPINYAAEGVKAQNVSGLAEGEELYIWRSLENVTIPSRYAATTLEYHGETVAAATVADSDAPTLLYLSNAAGDVGGYYIYLAGTDTLYAYQTINSVSKSYIILQPDGSVPVPDGFAETTITIDEKTVAAWSSTDAQGDVYLVYARNPDGEVGYYVYNAADKSLQRYAVMPARPVSPSLPPVAEATPAADEAPVEPAAEGITLSPVVFYAICGVGGLMLIAIVFILVSNAREKADRKRRAAARRAQREKERAQEQEVGQ